MDNEEEEEYNNEADNKEDFDIKEDKEEGAGRGNSTSPLMKSLQVYVQAQYLSLLIKLPFIHEGLQKTKKSRQIAKIFKEDENAAAKKSEESTSFQILIDVILSLFTVQFES